MTELAVLAIGLACLTLPIVLTGLAFRRVQARRETRMIGLERFGSVHAWDIPLMLGTIVFGGGAVIAGAGVIPGLVWMFDGDADARRATIVVFAMFPVAVGLAWFIARPSFRFWTVGHTAVSLHRRNGRREVSFAAITSVTRPRSLTGSVVLADGEGRVRIPGQVNDFDIVMDALASNVAPAAWRSAPTRRHDATAGPPRSSRPQAREWSVSRRRTRAVVTTMSLLLAFFVGWPWFLVEGDHPVRDSFAFAGIGIGLWLIILLLVAKESFQRGQPCQLRLRGELEYREFRGRWIARHHTDIVTATIEPDIIYVKGIPGNRTPLVIRFIAGSQLTLDDMRAKHLGSSTHEIARAIAQWRSEQPIDADAVTRARTAVEASPGEAGDAAATALSELVAIDPESGRHGRLFDLGELLRSTEEHERAIGCYRAHLDSAPHDAPAYEALAASYLAIGRRDLAADATAVAERILLNG